MKNINFISLIIFSFLVICSCNTSENGEDLSVSINIVSWEQNYWGYSGEWGLVEINFEITNTGILYIDSCTIWFEAECVDGSKYLGADYSFNILPETTKAEYTYIDTAKKEAIDVTVYDYELTHYDL